MSKLKRANREDYDLKIISTSEDKAYKSFDLDGDKVIGINKGDNFKILFTNKSTEQLQVRISVDGTDIVTGEPASTKSKGRMFLVDSASSWNFANSVLEINAWPEDMEGGAAFIFGADSKGVSKNTHGDTKGVGTIAVAVFKEKSIRSDYLTRTNDYSITLQGTNIQPCSATFDAASAASTKIGEVHDRAATSDFMETSDIGEEKIAVGAGKHTEQKLTEGVGLNNPTFDCSIVVRYETWLSLRKKISQFEEPESEVQNAFPGDNEKLNDLSGVPRQL